MMKWYVHGMKREIMRKLLDDIERKGEGIFEGVQFKYTEKEWSYIVSDTKQPKFWCIHMLETQ